MKKTTLIPNLILALAAAGALSAQTVTVSPTSLTFSALAGSSAQSQGVTVSGSTGTLFAISNQAWLKVCSGSGCAPGNSTQINNGSLTVTADPTGLSVGQYSGTVAIDNASLQQVASVPVTFTVAPIGVSPSSLTFNYQIGSTYPGPQTVTLTSAANTAYSTALSGSDCNWLQQPPSGTSPGTVLVSVNTANLPGSAGTHSCTIQFLVGSQIVPVPVTLVVAASPTVAVSPSPVNLFYQTGSTSSTNSASQVVTLTNPGSVALNYGIQNSNPSWLMVNPTQGTIPATGSTTVTVSYITSANLAVSSTPYQSTLVAFVSGASNNPIAIPVNLTVSTSPLLNLNNAPVKFTYQVGGAIPTAQSFTATTTNAEANAATGQMTLAISATYTSGGQWFTIPSTATTGSTPIPISLNSSVVATLSPGTYTGTVSVIGVFSANAPDAAHAIQIPVSLTVSNDPLIVLTFGNCTMTANNACPMNFPYETNISTAPSQTVNIGSSNNNTLSSIAVTPTMTAATNCTTTWLSVSAVTGAAGSPTFTVSANPAGIPNGTVCAGTVSVSANGPSGNASPNSPLTFPVKLYVSSGPMLVVNPISLSFSATPNSGLSAFQTLNVTSTDSSSSGQILFNAVSTNPWLVLDSFTHTTPFGVQVGVNPSAASLTPGTYNGTITLTSAGALDSGITVPVTLTIPSATMTADKTSLSFTQTLGGQVPASQNVTLSASGGTVAYTTAISYQSGQPTGWLNATQSGTIAAGSTGVVQVSVNGSSLAAGTYNGTVTITAPGVTGSPTTVNVTLVVAPGTLSVAPASLVFNEVAGVTAPSQNVQISGNPGALNFTIATSQNAPWLTASANTLTTPATLQVSAANTGLTPGTYTGQVTITSAGATGSPQTINVTLNVVAAQTITVSPATVNFSYTIGTAAPQAQTVQVSSSGGTAQFTATVNPGATWLVVSPANGATQAPLTVGVNPAGLGAGTYTGTIAIASPSSTSNPAATITVNLTVVAVPTPVITAIQNAASAIVGSVSPGENIVIYGSGIGPATLTMSTVTNNKLSTNVGQTQVFFDGIAAPIYYASSGQTSVFVPYGIAGRTSTLIVVSFQGVQSSGITQNVVATAPGVYTATASGSGPAVGWNYDLSGNYTGINSATNPAVKGGVVSLYVTGEGVTNGPAGIDGMLVTSLYKPNATVTATVGGQTASVQYAGSAPGSIYGVMQVNIQIPASAPSGATVPVVINVGGVNSQSAVTLAIQ